MKKILYLLTCIVLILGFSSCNLELQRSEDYKGTALDIYQHMTCWEYLEKHPDKFSSMMKAIEMCGMKDYYTQLEAKYTYLLLNEDAISELVKDVEANPYRIEELKDILKFHIIKGEYHAYGILDYNITFVETLLGDNMKMSLSLEYGEAHAAKREEVDRLLVMKGCGNSDIIMALESNLIMDNGPSHVLDEICVYKK